MSRSLLAGLTAVVLAFRCAYAAEDFRIRIVRESETDQCTTGVMYVNDKELCRTLELPWRKNRPLISSIPAATYNGILRYDKADKWRIQLEGVPDRSGIQIHVGNTTGDIQGCILVGTKVGTTACQIAESAKAYSALKSAFYGTETPNMTPDKKIAVTIASARDGTWVSDDESKRWTLEITGEKVNWTERNATKVELKRAVTAASAGQGFRIERPNDEEVMKFLGFNKDMQREILARSPKPSFMDLIYRDRKLTGSWNGLLATKDSKGKFKELKQPGELQAKQFNFKRQ